MGALERVAMDLMGLTSSVASALNTCLKKNDTNENKMLIKKWCEFYSMNLRPQTKAFVKKASVSLDKYGLFLPSRMSVSVSQELLNKGLQFSEDDDDDEDDEVKEVKKDNVKSQSSEDDEKDSVEEEEEEEEEEEIAADEEQDEEDDDDEYEDEEY